MKSTGTLTVDQAAERFGLSRREVIELIGRGSLTWTMAADKTVLVEMPSDVDDFQRQLDAGAKPTAAPPEPLPRRTVVSTPRTIGHRDSGRTITDLEAWSQRR